MAPSSNPADQLQDSEVFHILGNDRRRAIVQLLSERENHLEVSDVATDIADSEAEADTVPNNLYKSVYVSLQQTHLPQLEEDGVVEYDSEAKVIMPGPNYQTVLAYVDGSNDGFDDILTVHVLLAGGALALIAVAGIIDVFGNWDLLLVSVFVFVLIGASGIYGLFS